MGPVDFQAWSVMRGLYDFAVSLQLVYVAFIGIRSANFSTSKKSVTSFHFLLLRGKYHVLIMALVAISHAHSRSHSSSQIQHHQNHQFYHLFVAYSVPVTLIASLDRNTFSPLISNCLINTPSISLSQPVINYLLKHPNQGSGNL